MDDPMTNDTKYYCEMNKSQTVLTVKEFGTGREIGWYDGEWHNSNPPTPQESVEKIAQDIQDMYFENGAVVSIETWNKTKALLSSTRRATLEEVLGMVEKRKLPPMRKHDDCDLCPNCLTPWKCNDPHLNEDDIEIINDILSDISRAIKSRQLTNDKE